MAPETRPFNLLVLAAGSSTRMGSPKHLLPYSDGRPSYQNQLEMLQEAFPDTQNTYLFLREPSQQAAIQNLPSLRIQFIFETSLITSEFPDKNAALGSVAGLLAAFQKDPNSDWLIMPCDYPLMTIKELRHLRAHYRDPVTCFENGRGLLEPYAAIWGPDALGQLVENVAQGFGNPRKVIEDLQGTRVRPLYDHSLFNTNTKEDWEDAMRLIAGRKDGALSNDEYV